MRTRFVSHGLRENNFAHGRLERLESHPAGRTIMLVSTDRQLHESLRTLANTIGQMVVRAERGPGTVAILRATRPVVVLLDLDLPNEAAWEAGDFLLKEPTCPAVILLTANTEQFGTGMTTIRAGPLVSKGESACRLLEIVEEALEKQALNQAELNAIQRVHLHQLWRSNWAEEITPAYRFWGINE